MRGPTRKKRRNRRARTRTRMKTRTGRCEFNLSKDKVRFDEDVKDEIRKGSQSNKDKQEIEGYENRKEKEMEVLWEKEEGERKEKDEEEG